MSLWEIRREGEETPICRARIAEGFLHRLLGLMFRRRLEGGEGLLIRLSERLPGASVHTCFMRFPLDLLFLDPEGVIRDLKTLPPWRGYTPRGEIRWVLEVEEGTIQRRSLRTGERLLWKEVREEGDASP
jgi:hypothetical protein